MIEGSSRWRRDPGRDHSIQIREFKSLFREEMSGPTGLGRTFFREPKR